MQALKQRHLNTAAISTAAQYPTGYVRAKIDAQGVASYEFPDDVAWDHLHLNQEAVASAPELQAVCFGSLAQRSAESRQSIEHFLTLTPPSCLRIFDLNLRQDFYDLPTVEASLQLADVLKLNEDELYILFRMLDLNGNDGEQLATLLSRFDLRLVALNTRAPWQSDTYA